MQPNGELHIADFGKPQNIPMYFPSLIIRHLEEASDSVKGMLPEIFQLAGFQEIEEKGKYSSLFGTVALYKMRKPEKNDLNIWFIRSRKLIQFYRSQTVLAMDSILEFKKNDFL